MQVTLLHHNPLCLLVQAIRTCWDSGDKSDSGCFDDLGMVSASLPYKLGPRDRKLIDTVIEKNHTSTLEHLYYNFKIDGISRFNLQELARHRMASLSVKSTRYTLKELKDERTFIDDEKKFDWDRVCKYINLIGVEPIDCCSALALDNLRSMVQAGYPNDQTKACLPESYKVDLVWSINARSLRNFLELRSDPAAHFEIKELANRIFKQIPESHKFLYERCMK